jgi:hypothetical protein
MTHDEVQTWLNAYIEAWRSNDETVIRELFAPEANYAYHPYDDPERGLDAIVAAWLHEPDDPTSWEAAYAPALIDGRRAIATGETRYSNTGDVYSNLFELEFDADGRCTRFVEWYMKQPAG